MCGNGDVWEYGSGKMVKHFRDLRIYQEALAAAMKIFYLSKSWPKEERYSLTDQIRRASRSICGNIAEAWRKRRYPAHFTSKLSDADSEAAETQSWLDFACKCTYITIEEFTELNQIYERVSGGLVNMMDNAESWCGLARILKEDTADYETTPTPPYSRTPHTVD